MTAYDRRDEFEAVSVMAERIVEAIEDGDDDLAVELAVGIIEVATRDAAKVAG